MKNIIFLITTILMVSFFTGCPSDRSKMPKVLSDRVIEYAVSKYDSDLVQYKVALDGGNPDKSRRIRDEMIFKLKREIDANYSNFEKDMFIGRATQNILADITELGAGVAGNITNGERAKTIILAALTAFKGGRKSIDLNFFREKTTEILISKMRASRSRVETKISKGLTGNVGAYSLDESLGDLINYFNAGSLTSALVELSDQAALDAKVAKEEATKANDNRLAVRTEYNESVTIREQLIQIQNDVNGNDAQKAAVRVRINKALGTLKTSLKSNITFSDADTTQQLFDKLLQMISDATSEEKIPTKQILDAIKKEQ